MTALTLYFYNAKICVQDMRCQHVEEKVVSKLSLSVKDVFECKLKQILNDNFSLVSRKLNFSQSDFHDELFMKITS